MVSKPNKTPVDRCPFCESDHKTRLISYKGISIYVCKKCSFSFRLPYCEETYYGTKIQGDIYNRYLESPKWLQWREYAAHYALDLVLQKTSDFSGTLKILEIGVGIIVSVGFGEGELVGGITNGEGVTKGYIEVTSVTSAFGDGLDA